MKRPLAYLALLSCCLCGTSTAADFQISVPVTAPWTDTGIDVVAGQQIQIAATGSVSASGDGSPVDANGSTCCTAADPLPQTMHLSLIGKIGGTLEASTGTPVTEGLTGKGAGFVGSAYSQTAGSSGRLYLGFNDEYFSDNSGAFSVSVTIDGGQSFSNHTYQLITGDFTWHQAKADAEARGGHLATITSQAEFDYILTLGVLPSGGYWLGASDEAEEGVWKWVTGEPWSYNRWISGEPNDLGSEDYLVSSGIPDGHYWNDWGRTDSTVNQYILEIDTCTPNKAMATAELVNGFVVGATITESGCGYTDPPLVLIQGGGGSGATARAEIKDGRVTRIVITSAGLDYETLPRIVIASPPFVPTLDISVSKVKVVQNVVLGRKYVLEASHDGKTWSEAAPHFVAGSESVTNEFDAELTGRFFRVRETP